MERLIAGVTDSGSASGKCRFGQFSVLVKKGHDDCGDSAFVFSDDDKVIIAVFDGVSGEAGAANASSEAAKAVLGSLRGETKIDAKKMEAALRSAAQKITFGLTTAAVAFIQKDGKFLVAGIGDSPVYGISKNEVSLELPLARAVKDGDAVFKYFYYRNLLTSAIGQDSSGELAIRSGRLEKGEGILLASDGLSDNLYVIVKEGFVTDSSGCDDLRSLLKGKKSAESIVAFLAGEVAKRVSAGKIERPGSLLVPKEDDLSIAAFIML
ncbi:MAG TPA: protein phosphatase 2C domain-containing protein [Candidatus Bilamarchaeum sp.]|nr:protein phosphatase 2C domain-containing protein [Candidatus Bilamarchaeum sp.]